MEEAKKKLRVFFLEDNPDDIEIELYDLEKGGYAVEHERARNRKEFFEKILSFSPDVILADYSLPDITGIEAIDICRKMNVDAPVILITGEGNEEIAVDSLRLGAIDYIIKRNAAGLHARVSRALGIWSDRKAKDRAEAQEKRLQVLLYETQKMEAIGKLAGGIAHDFNNILLGIIGYADLCLADVPEDSAIRDKLETIISFSLRGADLIKQLLIFSRKVPMKFEMVDLNSFVADTVQFLKRILEETIEVTLDLAEDISTMSFDASQFTQLLMNLVLNARDAMLGKGVIRIKTRKCSLAEVPPEIAPQTRASAYVCLSVTDAGVGIDEKDVQKIFDPFFTTKDVGKGTGLGLSIVYTVVTAHRGAIKVSSKKGLGTTFSVYLPLLESEEMKTSLPPGTGMERKKPNSPNIETILIAEDEDVLRELAVSILNSQGYAVLAAKDGEEALNIIKSGQHKIDLIVSDMLMPRRGGVDLFKAVQSLNPSIKFVLVTGYSLAAEDEKIIGSMHAVLAKPYTAATMAKTIREILDRADGAQHEPVDGRPGPPGIYL